MLKNVQISEKYCGLKIAAYPYLEELGRDVSGKEYCNEAWGNAIEEGLIDEDSRDNYDIEIIVDVVGITPK